MKKLLYIAAVFFLACAAVFKFIFVGYGVTALCLTGAAACCAFFGFCHGRREKAVRRLRALAFLALAAALCLFLAAEIPVLAGSRSDEDTAADYAIVMGAGVNGTVPSLTLRNRLETAHAWLLENPGGVAVLSGGQGPGEDMTEAQCMYDWLTERGIAPERLLLESEATSSYENIRYSLKLIEAHGGDPAGTVAIVSNDYHLCRIRLLGEALGCRPLGVAARTPHFTLYVNYAVREAFALWEIWLFGIKNALQGYV